MKRFFSLVLVLILLNSISFSQDIVNVEPTVFDAVRKAIKRTKGPGLSSKYFSVGESDRLLSKAGAYLNGIAIDPAYLDKVTDKSQGLTQEKNPKVFTRKENRYNGWIILREFPAPMLEGKERTERLSDSETTAFHEIIHAHHLAIGSDADLDTYGAAHDITTTFYGIVMRLKESIDPLTEKVLNEIRSGGDYTKDLNRLRTSVNQLRINMEGKGITPPPQFYQVLTNIGGKCDWDGYIRELNAKIDEALQGASLPDIVLKIDYPKETAVGREFTITASASKGTPPFTYEWTNLSGAKFSGQSLTGSILTAGANRFILKAWDKGKYAKTPKEEKITINAFPLLAGTVSGPDEVESGKTLTLNADVTGGKPPYVFQWTMHGGKCLREKVFTDMVKGVPGEVKTIVLLAEDSLNPLQSLVIHKSVRVMSPKPPPAVSKRPDIIINKAEIIPKRITAGDEAEVRVEFTLKDFKITPVPMKATIWMDESSGGKAQKSERNYVFDRGVKRDLAVKLPTKQDGKPGKIKAVVKIEAEGFTNTAYAQAELVSKIDRLSVTLKAERSVSPPGGITKVAAEVKGGVKDYRYAWFLDGVLKTGEKHSYFNNQAYLITPGEHTVKVLVQDAKDSTAEASVKITVESPRMTGLVNGPGEAINGRPVTLSADIAGGKGPLIYSWSSPSGNKGGTKSFTTTLTGKAGEVENITLTVQDRSSKPQVLVFHIALKIVASKPERLPTPAVAEKPELTLTKLEVSPKSIEAGKSARITAHFCIKGLSGKEADYTAEFWLPESFGGKANSKKLTSRAETGKPWYVRTELPTARNAKPGPIKAVVKIVASGMTKTAYADAVIVRQAMPPPEDKDPFVGTWVGKGVKVLSRTTYHLTGKVRNYPPGGEFDKTFYITKKGSSYYITQYYLKTEATYKATYISGNKIGYRGPSYEGSRPEYRTNVEIDFEVNGDNLTGKEKSEATFIKQGTHYSPGNNDYHIEIREYKLHRK